MSIKSDGLYVTAETPRREQISKAGEAKFIILGNKRKVLVNNLAELKILSDYLRFDLRGYFIDYNPFCSYDTDMEMVISCGYKQSVSESHLGDFAGKLSGLHGSTPDKTWKLNLQGVIPLDIFINPEKNEEYFI